MDLCYYTTISHNTRKEVLLMKKLLAASLFVLLAACSACAEFKVNMDEYKCVTCQSSFFCFRGDDLDKVEVFNQPKKFHPLSDRSKTIKNCKNGYPMHSLVKSGSGTANMDFISKNMDKIIVIYEGRTLNQKLRRWECMLCGKEFFSFYDVQLNIREWYAQADFIKSVKGQRGIPQCPKRSEGYFGHVFKLKEEGQMTSWAFASSRILDNIYYVKW